jgi:hypothetical protein
VVGDLTLDYEALTVTDDPEQTLGLHTAEPHSRPGTSCACWPAGPAPRDTRARPVPASLDVAGGGDGLSK